MRARWLLWTLAAAAGLVAGTALVDPAPRRPPAAPAAAATRDVPRLAHAAAPDARGSSDAIAQIAIAAAPPQRVREGAGAADHPSAASAGSAADLEEELRWTEEAIAASQRLASPPDVAPRPDPPREAPAASAGAAIVALCSGAGLECHGSADCCPGLACVGGVAGYGTLGRCEEPEPR